MTKSPDTLVYVDSPTFSTQDQAILDSILGTVPYNVFPQNLLDKSLAPDQRIPPPTVTRLVNLEKKAILLEEQGRPVDALAILNKIIEDHPQYASAYNNRAQLLRIMSQSEQIHPQIIPDLEKAIKLARPTKMCAPMSTMQVNVITNAYGQLAAVYLDMSNQPENWRKAWDLKMQASEMLIEAQGYGKQLSGLLAARINPYAQLSSKYLQASIAQTKAQLSK